jgi:acyl-CoA thioesterase I
VNDAVIQTFVQYTHLEKLYGYLPGMAAALPGIFGLTEEQYADLVSRFDAHARLAAEDLLGDGKFAEGIAALPFRDGQTVLAVGDSITDDLISWADILRHALDLHRPGHGVRSVNGGLSAHTTAMILRRWPSTLTTLRPDWIICCLGGNDVTRIGPEPNKPQVSLPESIANLRELRRIAQAVTPHTRWVWMTPVPVHEERVAQFPPFTHGQSNWRNEDIVALAQEMHRFPDPVVDLTAVFGVPAKPDLQGPDGVHPTITGQSDITRALVTHLSEHGHPA